MKVRVKDVFRDKYTNEVYQIGKELNVDEKRYQEIKINTDLENLVKDNVEIPTAE